jgi:WD40 repeat protein/uncharacterized caspase-like protein
LIDRNLDASSSQISDAYRARAELYLKKGDRENAVPDLAEAYKLAPAWSRDEIRAQVVAIVGNEKVSALIEAPSTIAPVNGDQSKLPAGAAKVSRIAPENLARTAQSDKGIAAVSPSDKPHLVHPDAAIDIALQSGRASAQSNSEMSAQAIQNLQSAAISLAFAFDGARIVSGTYDGRVQLWDVKTGRLLRTMIGHAQSVYAVAFSIDGTRVISSGKDKTVKEWDASTGNLVRSVTMQSPAKDFWTTAISPDLRTILSGQSMDGKRSGMEQWEISTGQLLRKFPSDAWFVTSVAYSTDGSRAASSYLSEESGIIQVWDLSSGRLLGAVKEQGGQHLTPKLVALSPNGALLVSGSPEDWGPIIHSARSATLSEATTGRKLFSLNGLLGGIWAAAFSPDGHQLATVDNDGATLRLWQADTGGLLNVFPQSGNQGALAFSPDGTSVAFSNDGNIKLLDVKSGQLIRTFGSKQEFSYGNTSAYRSGGTQIVTSGSRLRIWDGQTLQSLAQLAVPELEAKMKAVAPDGKNAFWILKDGKTVVMTDMATGRARVTFRGSNEISSIAVSPDGTRMAFGSGFEKTVMLWDTVTGKLLRKMSHASSSVGVNSIAFSPDGARILSGASFDDMRLWEAGSGRLVRSFPTGSVQTLSVAFSPDGLQAFSGEYNGSIKQWDIAGGRLLRTYLGHSDQVWHLTVSHDGAYMLSSGVDNQVRLWRVANGQQLQIIMPGSTTTSMSFSADGKRALLDNEIFDLATGERLVSLIGSQNDEWLAVTPEGYFTGSERGAEVLSAVRGLEVSSIDQVYNALYRPDLVREKLAGDPDGKVKAAAAKLDLNKVMASGAAPRVAITSPIAGSSSAVDEVAVEATISDQGGGIGKVEWRINGVTSGIETRGLERVEAAASSGRSLTVKRTLALERGENRIEVLAYNAKDLIASEPASVTVTWDGEKTATPPKLYVMAVGVNDYYDSRLRLSYAVPDATAIAEGFRKAGTGLYAAVDVTTVLDKDVTIANLDKVFTELGQKAQPREVFVFFLAGHGKTKNGRYYFLPRDFRYEDEDSIEKAGMDQDKFQAWFAKIPARKSILLYDTCESGSLTGTKARGSDIDERLGALNRMTRATGRTFLTATTDDAPALEGYHGHGVFTYALLDALEHGDVNKNGLIEVSELADYIDKKVPDFSFEAFKLRQIPQRNIVGNNFALTNRAEVLTTGTAPAVAGNASPTAQSAAAAIPAKPTHVVIAPTPVDVFERAQAAGASLQKLPAGTLVTVIRTADGWTFIAKDGKSLGYVAQTSLAPMQ